VTDNIETKHNPEKQTTQNKTSLVQSLLTTLGQETGWAHSIMLPSPHRTEQNILTVCEEVCLGVKVAVLTEGSLSAEVPMCG